MKKTQIRAAYELSIEIEAMAKELEGLVNGKSGFLNELKKFVKDMGIQRLHEDVFILKQMSKHVNNGINLVVKNNKTSWRTLKNATIFTQLVFAFG